MAGEIPEYSPKQSAKLFELMYAFIPRIEVLQDKELLVMLAMRITSEIGQNSFPGMQQQLEEMGSDIRLLAWPVEIPGKRREGEIEAKLPPLGEETYPYFLSFAFSNEYFERAMLLLKTDPETNRANLAQTGIPYPVTGSDLSKEIHLQDN
jgi:hypothetical protein